MFNIFGYVFVFVLGLIIGSFIGALSYRLPKDISIIHGRSFCPNCKTKIAFYDNIPLLSFIILRGKCRNCGKNISYREPFIEFFTASVFTFLYFEISKCRIDIPSITGICGYGNPNFYLLIIYLFLIFTVLISIYIIDFENNIILDSFSFFIFLLAFGWIILRDSPTFFTDMLTPFSASAFFLMLHLATRGKGMGLGDVKLALPIGLILGLRYTLLWLTLSFIMGGVVAVILLLLRKTSLKNKIAFGPFMVSSFLLIFFLGKSILNFIHIN